MIHRKLAVPYVVSMVRVIVHGCNVLTDVACVTPDNCLSYINRNRDNSLFKLPLSGSRRVRSLR